MPAVIAVVAFNVQALAIDASPAYVLAVRGAAIVFDRFPIVRPMNDGWTPLHRDLHREVTVSLCPSKPIAIVSIDPKRQAQIQSDAGIGPRSTDF